MTGGRCEVVSNVPHALVSVLTHVTRRFSPELNNAPAHQTYVDPDAVIVAESNCRSTQIATFSPSLRKAS